MQVIVMHGMRHKHLEQYPGELLAKIREMHPHKYKLVEIHVACRLVLNTHTCTRRAVRVNPPLLKRHCSDPDSAICQRR